MTASPDRPPGIRQFVVDTISINALKTMPSSIEGSTATARLAVGPIQVWDLRTSVLTLLSLWPHPAPLSGREIPVMADLTRPLESGRWRFDIERLPAEVGDFFNRPDAEGHQIDMWLHPMHLPEGYEEEQEHVGKAPGVLRVLLYNVPPPDRIPEAIGSGRETLSGTADDPCRDRGTAAVDMFGPDLVTRQGQIIISGRPAPAPGLYATWQDMFQPQG